MVVCIAPAETPAGVGDWQSLWHFCAAVAGGKEALRQRPLLSLMQCSASPLGHDGGSLDAALVAAEYGLPTGFMTMAANLTTGPATLAGKETGKKGEGRPRLPAPGGSPVLFPLQGKIQG